MECPVADDVLDSGLRFLFHCTLCTFCNQGPTPLVALNTNGIGRGFNRTLIAAVFLINACSPVSAVLRMLMGADTIGTNTRTSRSQSSKQRGKGSSTKAGSSETVQTVAPRGRSQLLGTYLRLLAQLTSTSAAPSETASPSPQSPYLGKSAEGMNRDVGIVRHLSGGGVKSRRLLMLHYRQQTAAPQFDDTEQLLHRLQRSSPTVMAAIPELIQVRSTVTVWFVCLFVMNHCGRHVGIGFGQDLVLVPTMSPSTECLRHSVMVFSLA